MAREKKCSTAFRQLQLALLGEQNRVRAELLAELSNSVPNYNNQQRQQPCEQGVHNPGSMEDVADEMWGAGWKLAWGLHEEFSGFERDSDGGVWGLC